MGKSLPAITLAWFLIACRSTHPTQPPLSTAVFTPESSAIVFSVAQGETCFLYKADLATGVVKRLTQAASGCEFDPAFSADGKRLAFMRSQKSAVRAALVVANADGSGEQVLVPADEDNLQPAFVPHTEQIVFLRSRSFEHYSPLVDNRRHKFDLFAVDSATRQISALTNKQYYEISNVSVSPDGKQCLLTVSTYPEGEHFLIVTIQKPEETPSSLHPAVPQGPKDPLDYNARWLPDGRSLLFKSATLPPNEQNFDYNIYRLTMATGNVEQLTRLKGMLGGFSVSADGKRAVLLHDSAYSLLDLSTHQLTPVQLRWP